MGGNLFHVEDRASVLLGRRVELDLKTLLVLESKNAPEILHDVGIHQ